MKFNVGKVIFEHKIKNISISENLCQKLAVIATSNSVIRSLLPFVTNVYKVINVQRQRKKNSSSPRLLSDKHLS